MQLIRNVQFLFYGSKYFSRDGYLKASRSFDPRCGATHRGHALRWSATSSEELHDAFTHKVRAAIGLTGSAADHQLLCCPCSVMERKLTGKVCLVTGANQGLGLQVSQVGSVARRLPADAADTQTAHKARTAAACEVAELARVSASIYSEEEVTQRGPRAPQTLSLADECAHSAARTHILDVVAAFSAAAQGWPRV